MAVFTVGNAKVDFDALVIDGPGGAVSVEPKVLAVLRFLCECQGQVASRQALIDAVWAAPYGGDERLSRAISLLRKALGDKKGPSRFIETVPTRGYRLVAPVSEKARRPAMAPVEDRSLRIAVLPFRLTMPAAGETYFSDGIVDELITALTQFSGLETIGRRSSFRFQDSPLSATELATALSTDYLIDGVIQRHGDALHVTASLVDGASGSQILSVRERGHIGALFALQERMAASVVREVNRALELTGREMKLPAQTPNRDAFDLYLQGRSLTHRAIGDEVMAKAVAFLKRAVALDPGFAKGFEALAEAHVMTAVFTRCEDRAAEGEAMAAAARRAIRIDPSLGHARGILGLYRWSQFDPVGALDLAFEAYALEPDNPDVAARLGSFLGYIGRTEDAIPYIDKAIRLDPVYGRNFMFRSVLSSNEGEHEAAAAAASKMVDLGMPALHLGLALALGGRHEEGVDAYHSARRQIDAFAFSPASIGPVTPEMMDHYWQTAALGVCGGEEAARTAYRGLLDWLRGKIPDPADPIIAFPAVWMGQADLVFKTFSARISPANIFGLLSLWTKADPICRIRQHPEFLSFAETIGLTAAWEKYGWPDLLKK